jgi:hypothetical protein
LKSSLSLLHMMEKVSPGLNQVPIQRGANRTGTGPPTVDAIFSRPIRGVPSQQRALHKTRLTQAVLSMPPTFLSSPELLLGSRLTHSTKAHLGASPWTPPSRLSTYKPTPHNPEYLGRPSPLEPLPRRVALGAGLGLSSISPWSDNGVSASTFEVGTGIYLVVVAVMSSAIGGYLAARLRTKWVGLHSNEVFFRDTAHGFLAWAFATLISATALVSTTAYLANGTVAGMGVAAAQNSQPNNPAQIYVDKLFRMPTASSASTDNAAARGSASPAQNNFNQTRAEVLRLWTTDFRDDKDLTPDDRTYVAQLVAARTGLGQADAEKRVNQVIAEAKATAERTRRGAAHLSFWLTAALLFGAFAASLAAVEGGALRDGTWNDRVLTPRAL